VEGEVDGQVFDLEEGRAHGMRSGNARR
jgi:hypothetical protein